MEGEEAPEAAGGGGRPQRQRRAPASKQPASAQGAGAAGSGAAPLQLGAPKPTKAVAPKYFTAELKTWVRERCDTLGAAGLAKPLPEARCAELAAELKASLPEDGRGLLLRALCTPDAVLRCVNNYREKHGYTRKRAAPAADGDAAAQPKAKKLKKPVSEAEQAAATARREEGRQAAAKKAAEAAAAVDDVRTRWAALAPRATQLLDEPLVAEGAEAAAAVFKELEALFSKASGLMASAASQNIAVDAERLLRGLATAHAAWPWAAEWNARRTVLPGTVPAPALARAELPPRTAPSGSRKRRDEAPERRADAKAASKHAAEAMLREAHTAVLKSTVLGEGVLSAAAAAAAATRHGYGPPAPAAAAAGEDAGAAPAAAVALEPLTGGAAFACYVSPTGLFTSRGFNFPAGNDAKFKAFMREMLGAPPAEDPAAAARLRVPHTAEEAEALERAADQLGTAGDGGSGDAEEGGAGDDADG